MFRVEFHSSKKNKNPHWHKSKIPATSELLILKCITVTLEQPSTKLALKIHQLQLDSCWVTKDVHLEAPHYNDSLIGSSLQSGIREVFHLCMLGNTQRDEACFGTNDLWFDWSSDCRAERANAEPGFSEGSDGVEERFFQVHVEPVPPHSSCRVIQLTTADSCMLILKVLAC